MIERPCLVEIRPQLLPLTKSAAKMIELPSDGELYADRAPVPVGGSAHRMGGEAGRRWNNQGAQPHDKGCNDANHDQR